MRRHDPAALAALLVASGCDRLQSIPCQPPTTPEAWLASQPYAELTIAARRLVVVQPSSTVLVYLLGLMGIGVGVRFLRTRGGERSRLWWGVALVLWGVGALLAGTSYQAFSYAIKCAGRATCAWTSWWEVFFSILTIGSFAALMQAGAHACAVGVGRRALAVYSVANVVLYLLLVLTGAFLPNRFLVSFELLVLFATPTVLVLFGLSVRRYTRAASDMDLALIGNWLWLGLTVGAYYAYLLSGATEGLWRRGVWFSENDLLHVGLTLWMIYMARVLAPRLHDRLETPSPPR